MSLNLRVSAARAASSMISRSPLALVVAMRTPESMVALALCARSQFSARNLATRASSALTLASSAASAWRFLASSCSSRAGGFGAAGAAAVAASSPGAGAGAAGARAPGRWRTSLSGTLAGGGVSLNTLRPVLSTHCHCAKAIWLNARSATTAKGCRQEGRREVGIAIPAV